MEDALEADTFTLTHTNFLEKSRGHGEHGRRKQSIVIMGIIIRWDAYKLLPTTVKSVLASHLMGLVKVPFPGRYRKVAWRTDFRECASTATDSDTDGLIAM